MPFTLSDNETNNMITQILQSKPEYVVTASDDNTCKIIKLDKDLTVVKTLTGHSK